jgi:hypothetical protein
LEAASCLGETELEYPNHCRLAAFCLPRFRKTPRRLGGSPVTPGANQANPNGNDRAGETYLVYGRDDGAPLSGTFDLATADVIFNGINALDQSGLSVSSAGDVNGDGLDDLLIGAYLADPNGFSATGETYLVYGRAGTPGDFDKDGDVDGNDFLLWQRGESPDPLSTSDLDSWKANFGAIAPLMATSTVVPEPGSLVLLLSGALAIGVLIRPRGYAIC